jgi:hypothetical protein
MVKSNSLKKIIITLLVLLFANVKAISQDTSKITDGRQFIYGAKIGLNYMRLSNLTKTYSIDDIIDHYYRPGYSIGVFIEHDIFSNTSLSAELNYQYNTERIILYTGYNGIIEKELKFSYINIPILIKYKLSFFKNLTLLLGPSFNIQIGAKQKYHDRVYGDKGEMNMNKELSAVSMALDSGVGYNFDLSGFNIITEIRTQWDLAKKKYTADYLNIGEWKNLELALVLGVQF